MSTAPRPTVVLVHGGFVDGSGWRGVYDRLRARDHRVTVVQNSTVSLESDVTADQAGPRRDRRTGHPGRSLLRRRRDHRDRQRPPGGGLVYIAAFAPDKGESVNSLIADPAPGAPVPPILPPRDGYLFLNRDKFHESFAGDLSPTKPPSWPTPRSPGESTRWAEPSPSPAGG